MKFILSFILLFGSIPLHAQNSDSDVLRAPKIICKIKLGKTADFGDYSVKFIRVISDSRCPKNVTCVWAGEAKILVEIYKAGKSVGSKEVVIGPTAKKAALVALKNKTIKVYGLSPYPVDRTQIEKEKYILNLVISATSE